MSEEVVLTDMGLRELGASTYEFIWIGEREHIMNIVGKYDEGEGGGEGEEKETEEDEEEETHQLQSDDGTPFLLPSTNELLEPDDSERTVSSGAVPSSTRPPESENTESRAACIYLEITLHKL